MHSIRLVRHAETTLNATRTVQYADTPLSEHGVWQAQRLAIRLRDEGVTHLASSDYARAHATALAVQEATQAELTIDPLLRERHLGTLRGRPYAEIEELVFSETVDPEGGERWLDFVNRLDRLWHRVTTLAKELDAHGPCVLAVVTHGLVCRGLAARHLTLPTNETPARFPNASVTVIDPAPPWRVRVLASQSHLADETSTDPHRTPGGHDLTAT